MKLTELLKEHPEAAAEVEAITAQAREGAAKARNEENAQAAKILASDEYPASVKEIAAKVVTGEEKKDLLSAVVAVYDANRAGDDVKGATAESNAAGATPPQAVDTPAADGTISTAADFDAAVADLKGGW